MRATAAGILLALVAAGCRKAPVEVKDAASPAPLAAPLPSSGSSSESDGLVVVVNKTQLLVGDDLSPVLRLPSNREEIVRAGVGAKYKKSETDLLILPLATVVRGRSSPPSAVVIIETSMPYRLLTEVLFTLGQSGFSSYHMMVLHQAGADAGSPHVPGPNPPGVATPIPALPGKRLDLRVTVTSDGVSLRTSAGPLGLACDPTTTGVTVPRLKDAEDTDAIRRCASRIKRGSPSDTSAVLAAAPGIEYGLVIDVMDAVHTDDGGGEMFPDVSFEPMR